MLLLRCFGRIYESFKHIRACRVLHAAVLDWRGVAVGGAD